MGFFNNTNKDKVASSDTKTNEVTKQIKAVATTSTGKKKEEVINTPTPKLKAVTWGLPIKDRKKVVDAKQIHKTANGVKSYLYIQSEGSTLKDCNALIVLESEAWGDYFEAHLITVNNAGKTNMTEQDLLTITPSEINWKDKGKKTSKISATVYLFTYTGKRWLIEDTSEALALEFNPKLKPHDSSTTASDAIYGHRLVLHGSPIKSEIDFDYCGHGMGYREDIYCTKSNQIGPIFNGKTKMGNYSGWDDLVKKGKVTLDEKRVISVMAKNEGEFESVQSYDDQVISVGAMQKTINTNGEGELTTQIYEFQKNYKVAWEKYKCCFEYHQWTFVNENWKYIAKHKDSS